MLLLLVVMLGIGYAFLQTILNISGTATVKGNTWSIYWNNIQITPGSVSVENPSDAEAIDPTDNTKINFTISLEKPGDFYEFTVDVVNNGSIDAMISDIDSEITENNYNLDYINLTVSYDDDLPIVENQLLRAKQNEVPTIETYKIRVEYKQNINANQLPGDDETLSYSFEVEYSQADSNAVELNRVYSSSIIPFTIGEGIPNNTITHNTYIGAIQEFGHQVFMRYRLSNNQITNPYMGFEKDGYILYSNRSRILSL